VFGIFGMARSLRNSSSEEVLTEFEKELRDGARDIFQVHATRSTPDGPYIYKLYVKRLTGPRGARFGWFKFEHEAAYLPGAATPVFTGPLTVSGDLDLLAAFGIDSPHKLGLAGAVRLIKETLVRRGMDVEPLATRSGTLIPLAHGR
jgi:hypothetical protein